ncbi:MAG: outer membrane beta-barrel protein [Bacteroidaceae bacterium]|nr:outer membrane beta-barrel protein [Bacteroidaceae bacterium]
MRRQLYLIIYMCAMASPLLAQEPRSLLSALQSIEQSQSEYTIDIVSDGLENLTTSAPVEDLDAVTAVKRVCKGLPVKVKVQDNHIYVQAKRQSERQLKLKGEVQDIRAHKQLIGATVELLRPDSTLIAQKEARQKWFAEIGSWETSEFSFLVPAQPAKYLFRISFEGHQTTYVEYTLDHIGRREHERGLPPFYLAPVPQTSMMREVTITASKVKFYYKSDTIIYNADAFILAEGSMLDALIRQLPGVEMKSDGRIYHEGKFVDDLLLNGKEFFRHDRKLMLENLPAYTVKDIAIYDKQTAENEWLGIKDERTQRHVIDVRLKKEYMIGWMANVEVGGGTSERYLARLFAMRHTDFSRLAIVANANNLDDDSRPGESDNWQRGKTNDLRRTERSDLSFNVSDRNKRWELAGNASVHHQRTEDETHTVRQNYLPTGDTYDHSFSSRRNEDLRLSTWQSFARNHKSIRWHIDPNLNYHRFDHSSDLASATFNAPVADVSRQLLDELYSPASSRINLRDTLVNRILRQGMGKGHDWKGSIDAGATIKIPHSNENLRLGGDFSYNERNEQLFDHQSVNYAATSLQPSTNLHHFTDNHPHRDWNASAMIGYNLPLGPGWRSIFTYYEFNHLNQHHRSSLYLLEPPSPLPLEGEDGHYSTAEENTTQQIHSALPRRGSGEGVSLPSVTEYQQVMDRSNSYDSHFKENRHMLHLNLGYKWDKKKYGQFWTLLNGDIFLRSQHLDYQRGSIDTTLCRTAFTINMGSWTYLDLAHGQLGLELGIEEKLPDLEQRIDLRDDTDPMNVRLGNPDLRTAVTPHFGLRGVYRQKQGYHALEGSYEPTFNALAMGYVYDTRTGVRTYRPDNVNGNYTTDGGYTFYCSLDSTKKFNLDLPFHVTYSQNVDLVGVESGTAPSPSTVHRLALSFSPTFKADIGKHHLELTCQPTWERLTGNRADFENFSAFTCRTTLSAILKLHWELDLSTDLSLYSRTGYADPQLNTNDLVWNARLTRPFLKGKLLVMLDGFDILGQLSNVTRTLNAQGRTETYTNIMPRYALLHVVYRLNKKPKNRE